MARDLRKDTNTLVKSFFGKMTGSFKMKGDNKFNLFHFLLVFLAASFGMYIFWFQYLRKP